jgi:FkbM family methyltransferase
VKSGVHACLSRRRSRVRIPSSPPYGQIAQSVEHLSEKQGVGSSILPLATYNTKRRSRFFWTLVKNFVDILNNKFENHQKVKILNFGLLDENKDIKISSIGAGSSIFARKEGKPLDLVEFRSFIEFVNNNSIKKIHLLYMNIEGSEYQLLKHIIETNFIKNIDHIQIQFHNYIEGSKKLRNQIRKELKETHKCKFNFPFIWERWDRIT